VTAELESPQRWGMPDAAICFAAGLFGGQLAVSIAIGAGGAVDSLWVTGAGLIGLWVGLLVSMVIVTRMKGSGSLATDFGLRFERGHDLVGIPIGIGFQLLVVPLLYVPLTRVVTDLSHKLEAPARQLSDQATHGTGLAVLAVLVVAGAPVVEELFYRGLLLRAVQRRFGPRVAIAVSAVAFAGAHFELLQFPALLALGVLLGVLAVRYGRLGPGIFAHAGFNAVTMAILIATR
jgi:membrane protease YdiL (CAAX protease family)